MSAQASSETGASPPAGNQARPPALARRVIAMRPGYHSPQLEVEVRLNTNESPLPPPAALSEAVAEAVRSVAWNRYPDRQAAVLRRSIAARHGVSPDCVFAANGTNEVLLCVLLAYAAAGRTAAVFEPTFAMHGHLIRVTGAQPAVCERDDGFRLDAAAAVEHIAATRPSVTFLCSPNNPTGMVEPPSAVAAVLEAVRSAGGLLCVDEAYGEFAAHSALDLLEADPDCPLVVTRTYSKAWAMAAARLGYLVGPPWAVAELQKVVLPYHLDSLKQAAGVAALEHADAMRGRVRALVAERERLTDGLRALPAEVWPSGANFVLFRPRPRPGGEVWQELVDRSVLVRDCSSWPRFAGCLRVTVGTAAENDRFLAALAEIIA